MGRRRTFDEHEKSAYWVWWKNGDVQPTDVAYGCHKKFWFWCDNKECKHHFEASPASIVAGSWCPYCRSTKLCSDEKCKFCFNKSFASHPRAVNWSSKNKLTPRMVNKGTTNKYYFDCDVCGHELYNNIRNVARGSWCGYCYGVKLCLDVDCKMCYNASFASHPYAKHWSKKNEQQPREVFRGMQKKFYFDCPCGHEIFMPLESFHKGYGCHYCCERSVKLCSKPDCKACEAKSFASHEMAKHWSSKNEKTPRQVFKCSLIEKYWFNCDKDPKHEFQMSTFGVSHGNWCTICTRKGERKLYDKLNPYHNLTREKKFPWLRSEKGGQLRFDFELADRHVLIELDGGQHFKQVKNWKGPSELKEIDDYKMNLANEHGFSVIRVTWDDVYRDQNDWLEKVLKYIEEISSFDAGGYKNYFICSKGEYDSYVE